MELLLLRQLLMKLLLVHRRGVLCCGPGGPSNRTDDPVMLGLSANPPRPGRPNPVRAADSPQRFSGRKLQPASGRRDARRSGEDVQLHPAAAFCWGGRGRYRGGGDGRRVKGEVRREGDRLVLLGGEERRHRLRALLVDGGLSVFCDVDDGAAVELSQRRRPGRRGS